MSDLLKLAERCEKATGPDRELDKAVGRVVGFRMVDGDYVEPEGFRLPIGTLASPPLFTASLDAAMTLVPDGLGRVMRDCSTTEAGKAFARLYSPDFRSVTWGKGREYITEITDGFEATARAETWPLALCAAALRAREEDKNFIGEIK